MVNQFLDFTIHHELFSDSGQNRLLILCEEGEEEYDEESLKKTEYGDRDHRRPGRL